MPKGMPNSGEHAGSARAKLQRLLQYHEHIVESLQTSLGLLDGVVIAKKMNGAGVPHFVAQAVASEAARKAAKPKKPYLGKEALKAQRVRTAAMLAKYDRTKPRPTEAAGRAIGIMVTRGYLVKKGDGYIRTAKEFTP